MTGWDTYDDAAIQETAIFIARHTAPEDTK